MTKKLGVMPAVVLDPEVEIGSLQFMHNNPRIGDRAAIKRSMRRVGWFGTCVARTSNREILVGNNRVSVWEELGHTHVPVYWVDVDDQTAARIALADNRTQDLATYDYTELVANIHAIGDDVDVLAVTTNEMREWNRVIGLDDFEPKELKPQNNTVIGRTIKIGSVTFKVPLAEYERWVTEWQLMPPGDRLVEIENRLRLPRGVIAP
jgi:hypothetical protein